MSSKQKKNQKAENKKRTRGISSLHNEPAEKKQNVAAVTPRETRSSSSRASSTAVASSSPEPATKKTRRTSPVKSTDQNEAKKGSNTEGKKKESKKKQVKEEEKEEEEDKEMVNADDDMAEENNTEEKEEFDAEWIARVEAIQRGEEYTSSSSKTKSKAKVAERRAKEQEETRAQKEKVRIRKELEKTRQQEIHTELRTTQLIYSNESRTFVRSHLIKAVAIPNVLSDLIVDYMYSPLLLLWEEIELLCQMHDRERMKVHQLENVERKETKTISSKGKKSKAHEDDEKVEPPRPLCGFYVRDGPDFAGSIHAASPLVIDQLEWEYRAQLNDPTFHFPADLKLLWSIRDGFDEGLLPETTRQTLFDGRLWPSLTSMQRILLQSKVDSPPLSSCQYVMLSKIEAQYCYWWWKCDLVTGVIWVWGQPDEEWNGLDVLDEGADADRDDVFPRIVFQSLTHFVQCLKSSLIHVMMEWTNKEARSYRWNASTPLCDADLLCRFSHDAIKLAQKKLIFLASDTNDLDAVYEAEWQEYIYHGSLTKKELVEHSRRVCRIEREWIEYSQKQIHRGPTEALALLESDQNMTREEEKKGKNE